MILKELPMQLKVEIISYLHSSSSKPRARSRRRDELLRFPLNQPDNYMSLADLNQLGLFVCKGTKIFKKSKENDKILYKKFVL